MCKIAIITQHNPSERDAIIARVWAYFSQSGENDGFGAAWLDEHGKLAYVKRRHQSAGTRFHLGDAQGSLGHATIVPLPVRPDALPPTGDFEPALAT